MAIGLFENWKPGNLPKCVHPANANHSTIGMSRRQRDYVLACYGYPSYKAYLQSELWADIRAKVLREMKCCCGCGARSTQVHHRSYTEANLLGLDLRGLVGLSGSCHKAIEFTETRKTSLGQANRELESRQFDHAASYRAPTEDEIRLFLSGKHRKLTLDRKLAVKRHLKANAAK